MDRARYRDLLAKDAQLEQKLKDLENAGVPRDPAYKPPGLESDLMYADQYVDAVYNPESEEEATSAGQRSRSALSAALRTLVVVLGVLAGLAFLVWLVFFKRW
jgi:hypothetical protein